MSTSTQPVSSQLTPSTSTLGLTWEARIRDAAAFMGISISRVEEGLKTLGVEKEPAGLEMLSDESITPFGDIRAIFCDNDLFGKIPIAKVRLAMKYLRGPKGSSKTDTVDPELVELKSKYGIRMKLEDVDISELLEHYHPEQPNHPITTALKKKYGDKSIIVFKPDSKVIDIEQTANYVADLEQGYPEQETVEVDGVLVRIYPVGKVPNQMVEEDPLFNGTPLKRGRSTVNRVNWSEIGRPLREWCRIIVELGFVDANDRYQVQELLKLVRLDSEENKKSITPNGTFPNLRKMYPEADLEYRERALKNDLPKLLLPMEETNGRKQNPFNIGNNRKF